jgi:holo-[acyl-carrier protein] synthase
LHSQQLIGSLSSQMPAELSGVVRLGIDLVHIPRIQESLQSFGDAFAQKLFTAAEIAYADAAAHDRAQRYAARFAAKEAAIKALSLSDAGISWRDIEVQRAADGSCSIALHGEVAAIALAQGIGRCIVCLSHDGDYAAAVVAALSDTAESPP